MLKLATKFRPEREAFLRACRTGFRNAEIYLNRDLLEDYEAILRLGHEFPLNYAIHFPNRGDLDYEHLYACVELYRSLGCKALVIHQPMFDRYADELRQIDNEIVLAIENHHVKKKGFADWMDAREFVTIDVEHIWVHTLKNQPVENVVRFVSNLFDEHAHRIRHIHMPGCIPGMGEHRPMYTSRDMVLPVFDILDRHNFDGLIVSEIGLEYQNDQDMRMDVLLFEGWFEKLDPQREKFVTAAEKELARI